MQKIKYALLLLVITMTIACNTSKYTTLETVTLNIHPYYECTAMYNWNKTAMDSLVDVNISVSVPTQTKWLITATNNDVIHYLSTDKTVELEVIGGRVTAISICDKKDFTKGVTYITE